MNPEFLVIIKLIIQMLGIFFTVVGCVMYIKDRKLDAIYCMCLAILMKNAWMGS